MHSRAAAARAVGVAALALAAGLALPVISADVWAYAAYGALLAHGADPWAHAYRAADVAPFHDALLAGAVRAWDGSLPRDVYGPLFTVPCAAVVAVTRSLPPAATLEALRLAAAAALLACLALAARMWPRLVPLLAFHPVVLWGAAEGHNDAFWLALVLASGRASGAAPRLAALTAAAAVKAVAVVPLALALARVPARRVLAIALSAAALALAYAPLIAGVMNHGLDHGVGPPRISLLHASALAAWAGSPVPLACAGVLAVAGAAAVVRALRTGAAGAGAALAGWLLLPAPEPWYALWLVCVVAAVPRSPASRALLAASFTGAVGYVQDVVPGTAPADPALLGGTMLALYALPILVALTTPSPSRIAQASPAPAASATPAPQPTATSTPVPTPTPAPTSVPTPNPFTYVVAPSPGPAGSPRIVEIALNDRVMHKGGILLVRVTTSPDVTAVVARTMGHEIGIPQGAPGYFAGQEQLPSDIPFFLLNRTYQIDFVASTADGRRTTYSMPLRLER